MADAVPSLEARYKAAMILSGVGDAMGYKNGEWEFARSGLTIEKELKELGGFEKLNINNWRVSDDTVLHLATAEALVSEWKTTEELFSTLARKYKTAVHNDMWERAPGLTTTNACWHLRPNVPKGYCIKFNEKGGGCGAAMRTMCIGLLFPDEEQLEQLIEVAVESGRMTHNHPTGFLGSVTTALFMSYSIQRRPVESWGAGLMSTLPKVWDYVELVGRDVKENRSNWSYFVDKWQAYLKLRCLEDGKSEAVFPEEYGVYERDVFYKSISFSGWGGASGHDAPMIAYDAILRAKDSWKELCCGAVLHGGDSDSTGVMAAAWWGGWYGMDTVPDNHHKKLEYRKNLEKLAKDLLAAAQLRKSPKL